MDKLNRYLLEYIDLVESGAYAACKYQHQLIDYVRKAFADEGIYVDDVQAEKYFALEKYFPYRLFPWERFCFVLHNCTYRADGRLRWPILFIYIGRGAGKNGYLAFEDFALLTPINGVKEYHIDIFAMSEKQAKASWEDVYNVLEKHESVMKKHFYWNKEQIKNIKTGSIFSFNTSSPKTKDGARPGKVDFDEYHAYENYKLIDVGVTGLGKKKHPRRTIITTDGLIRGGPLDDLKEKCVKILNGEEEDNGTMPFMCCLNEEKGVHEKSKWYEANPSLQYLPDLLYELELEYGDYVTNPAANISFISKRMNRPPMELENAVTSFDNIKRTNQPIPEEELVGRPCVAGFDYMKTTDLLGAGLLYRVDGKDVWVSHTWVCKQSPDLIRIHAPLDLWERMGLLTFVDGPEIPPELPALWVATEAARRNSKIIKIGIDYYRYTLLSKALKEILYTSTEKGYENIKLVRPSDEMMAIPSITSGFVNGRYVWGDNPLMRWACNNAKTVTSAVGNITYGKIEPKSRKTDPFKAFVAAECVSSVLDDFDFKPKSVELKCYTY